MMPRIRSTTADTTTSTQRSSMRSSSLRVVENEPRFLVNLSLSSSRAETQLRGFPTTTGSAGSRRHPAGDRFVLRPAVSGGYAADTERKSPSSIAATRRVSPVSSPREGYTAARWEAASTLSLHRATLSVRLCKGCLFLVPQRAETKTPPCLRLRVYATASCSPASRWRYAVRLPLRGKLPIYSATLYIGTRWPADIKARSSGPGGRVRAQR